MLLSHGCSSRGISCLLFTRTVAEVTVFSHEFSSCPELSNLRIGLFSHGASRMVTVLLSRDLSFGPTDQREVICELSNCFFHTESHGGHGLIVPNYRIIELVYFHTDHRGESRFSCPEFANCRIFLHTEHRGESRGFVTNYRIIEFLFTRRIAEGQGVLSRIVEFLFTRRVTEVFFVTRHVLCHEFAN